MSISINKGKGFWALTDVTDLARNIGKVKLVTAEAARPFPPVGLSPAYNLLPVSFDVNTEQAETILFWLATRFFDSGIGAQELEDAVACGEFLSNDFYVRFRADPGWFKRICSANTMVLVKPKVVHRF